MPPTIAPPDERTSPPSAWRPWIGPGLLAVGATIALTFVSLELPQWLAALARRWVDVPDLHPAIEPDAIDRFIRSHHLSVIGWTALGFVIAAVVAGLATRRRVPAFLGAALLWLPTFGSFTAAMFFLAGLGVLRVLWIPFWSGAMALGDIAYLPYMAVVWPLWEAGVDAREWVTIVAIAAGLALFTAGTATWLRARLSGGGELITGGVYRICRHPQYLGWIVWTYGMTLLAARQPVPMAGENPGAALPWVVSSLIVVAVAMVEERHLLATLGDAYRDYRRRTAMFLPLPRPVRRAVGAPLRWVAGEDQPPAGWRLLAVICISLAAVVVLSLPFALADWPSGPSPWATWPAW